MPERLECEILQKARYINTLTFLPYLDIKQNQIIYGCRIFNWGQFIVLAFLYRLTTLGILICLFQNTFQVRAVFRKEINPSFMLFWRLGSVAKPLFLPLNFSTARGSDLRAIVSRQTGLPVGIFRLTTEAGQEIFDCHILESYGLQLGCTVYLETWDGWNELIPAAISGITKQVSLGLIAFFAIL